MLESIMPVLMTVSISLVIAELISWLIDYIKDSKEDKKYYKCLQKDNELKEEVLVYFSLPDKPSYYICEQCLTLDYIESEEDNSLYCVYCGKSMTLLKQHEVIKLKIRQKEYYDGLNIKSNKEVDK